MILDRTVSGYRVWGIDVGKGSAQHYMFLRRHREKGSVGGTVFVANLPGSDLDVAALSAVFGAYGSVESVDVGELDRESKQLPTHFARVKMASEESVEEVLSAENVDLGPLEEALEKRHKGGMDTLLEEFAAARPGKQKIQQWAEGVMATYEENEKKRKEEEIARSKQVDADGFQLVARRGRAALSMTPEAVSERMKRRKKRLSDEAPPNFYRFQERQAKRKRVQTLREDFKRDQERVRAILNSKSMSQ